ncbi:hypothetical protein CDL15_Pgr024451 [Punica granatum]|uniref:Uncharacterized protein n=1 Tax=Punica granatum TaxID=22663 RepID=A0A218XXH7_PUNGR|nr:hypothetical protein CDL15_Pgr024451 [Punica granatum]
MASAATTEASLGASSHASSGVIGDVNNDSPSPRGSIQADATATGGPIAAGTFSSSSRQLPAPAPGPSAATTLDVPIIVTVITAIGYLL